MISKAWLNRQPKHFIDNSITKSGKHIVYHISLDPVLKELVPRIGNNQDASEDRSIPRICVSLTLADAIAGYGRLLTASIGGGGDTEKVGANRDPIFHIYTHVADGIVVPNEKLRYDAKVSGEVWLVADKPENTSITMKKKGEFFILRSNMTYGVSTKPDVTVLLISVANGYTITLENNIILTNGWYKAVIHTALDSVDIKTSRVKFEHKSITRNEYMIGKAAIKDIYTEDS